MEGKDENKLLGRKYRGRGSVSKKGLMETRNLFETRGEN